MNKKLVIFLAFLTAFAPLAVSAASIEAENSRYFVMTNKGFWKNTLGVRHGFEDGFTTDLSDWQLRFAKLAGLKVYAVQKLNILPDEVAQKEDVLARPARPSPSPSTRPVPSEQFPWGIRTAYNDLFLTQTSGGASASVAVLDTGVFKDHPDLKNRVKQCKDFTSPKAAVVEGKCDDKNGHGTHVAGIIAADGGADGLGIYGIAPETSLYAYKVCGANGSCWSDDIAAALRTAADNGAQVVNLSLGSDVKSSLITDAVAYAAGKGVLVVAAAGNDGPYFDSIDYPGALAEVAAVGALDSAFVIPDWSSHGINSTTEPYVVEARDIEFAAPGVNVESTWKDGSYVILSGTSMASPHVAGLAAKLWQGDAAATRLFLQNSAHELLPPGDDDSSGFGLPTL